MIILSREDVKKALGMEEAISAMEGAFKQLSDGQAEVPVRMNVDMSQENGCVLLMPAYLTCKFVDNSGCQIGGSLLGRLEQRTSNP